MSNDKPITLEQLFRYKKPWGQFPHQDAAIIEMEEDIEANGYAVAMRRDRPWFLAWSQAGKQPDPIYLAPALRIIQEFEACNLVAYADSTNTWTVGWGNTQLDGRPVKQGDKISQSKADTMLRDTVQQVAARLHKIIPATANYGGNQQAALISWMYNVGSTAAQDSTLARRLNAGEPGTIVIPQELPKWDKANGKPLLGLTRRRAAEVALFTGTKPTFAPPLPPPPPQPKLTPGAPFSFRVTPHITYGELCLNEERRRFVNEAQCQIATELCTFIERARAQFGNQPVIITSAHRPKAVNDAVGGAADSEHLYKPGCGAIDWYIKDVPVKLVQDWCDKNWPFSLGYGAPQFIHLGVRSGRPKVRWNYN
jgi:GH24 family phage-related lysozyme (muramidase)